MTDCVFCPDNWHNLDIVQDIAILRVEGETRIAILNPLDPVTDGHVLVISSVHSANAAEHPGVARDLMQIAAQYVADNKIQANIITSIGPLATQTVMHTHVHVVPRRENDGLPLPWTPQHELKRLRVIQAMQQVQQESGFDGNSVGLFQQRPRMSYLDALNAEQDAHNLRTQQ